jgi:uncharacterized membrane protein YhaH (DUF805 family)
MTLGQAISTVFGKYAEFSGRAGRAEFWWWILFTALVSAGLNTIFTIWLTAASTASPFFDGSPVGTSMLSGLWGVAVLLPTLAVAVRRLRDAGFDWGHIFWLLLPFAGVIVLIILCAQPTKPAPADSAAYPPGPAPQSVDSPS